MYRGRHCPFFRAKHRFMCWSVCVGGGLSKLTYRSSPPMVLLRGGGHLLFEGDIHVRPWRLVAHPHLGEI